jgi:glycosyltransferase involved in cell wall biosynthesis
MKSLITFGLVTYKQERFVGEALESALAQTYSPLEIVISDDCSPDRTFEIAREIAARYHGPHKLVLNRNESNLGPAGNVNRMIHLAQGELIVAAAGDDVSIPQRTASLFEAWDSTGRTAGAVHSRVLHIDDTGRMITRPAWELSTEPTGNVIDQSVSPATYVETLKPGVFGCAAAWNAALFRTFGALPNYLVHEDSLLTLRSLIMGGVVFVDSSLVKYRLHSNNLYNSSHELAHTWESIKDQENRMQRNYAGRAGMYGAFCRDLLRAHEAGLIPSREFSKAYANARHHEHICNLQSTFLTGNIIRKIDIYSKLARAGVDKAELRKLSLRLLPVRLLQSAKLARAWLKLL